MVGGHDTLAQPLIEALGATNAFAAMSGYKPVSAEGIIPAAPDVVIVPQAGLDALGGDGVEVALALFGSRVFIEKFVAQVIGKQAVANSYHQ